MPVEINVNSVISRSKDLIFSNLDDEFLAIDSQAGYVFSMNATAGRIWDIIKTPVSISDICSQLCLEFTVETAICLEETQPVLQQMLNAGLIQVHYEQTFSE